MNRFYAAALGAAMLCLTPLMSMAAPLVAKVDVSTQTMTVIYNGKVAYRWPVSTARQGKHTPRGQWNAYWLSKYHKSSIYNNAPMPFAIFFNGDYAIHGTDQISRLGRPASAGCVRLHPEHAAVLFELTRQVGKKNMKVVIDN
ncbi:L,D-transpeptidase [Mameliella sediminis]|uniref:L,D-transpeptidase n=1 Tax=Mameliella sediminis TaxID=2836866 RepID=UPI001C4514E8|nr:L,D-transpeptidase [Mameliella sediminis]MBY6115160.1 L,D-transpeptidase [Antarctobacter heliothermus]MBY6144955.1 L,D-transpeptidase [Mameliella alba]MBV7396070.1 L,D-transpeptidase [Mameliella sediminis]MBY6160481.1 L,D-transpeptidase [Mameliella alba]MBY6168951.1 L,D-transpeptidase [Mameliella alba]